MTDTGQLDSREYLVINIGERWFALPSFEVEYTLPPGGVTPLPFVPEFVSGLISVNEQIMPLIDLRQLLGDDEADAKQDNGASGGRTRRTELVVINTGRSRCALHCQNIVTSTSVAEADIVNTLENDDPDNDSLAIFALTVGRFEFDQRTVHILDPARIGELISPREMATGDPGMIGEGLAEEVSAASQQEFLVFRVAGERFAFRIDDVAEILDVPPSSPISGAPEEIEGVQIVRGEVLITLSLKCMLGLSGESSGRSSVIVIRFSGRSYGLRVDEIVGIQAYDEGDARVIEDDSGDIAEVVVDGDDVISLLTPSRLVSHERRARLAPFIPAPGQEIEEKEEAKKQVLMTRLGAELIGIPVDIIASIAEITPFETVQARKNPVIQGALSLKGNILPVLDSHALLGQESTTDEPAENWERGAWIVLGEEERSWALAVNEAREIIDIPESLIRPVEAASARFVYALANVDGQLISLVDIASLERAA